MALPSGESQDEYRLCRTALTQSSLASRYVIVVVPGLALLRALTSARGWFLARPGGSSATCGSTGASAASAAAAARSRLGRKGERHDVDRVAGAHGHRDVLLSCLGIGDRESSGRPRQLNLRDDGPGLLVPR